MKQILGEAPQQTGTAELGCWGCTFRLTAELDIFKSGFILIQKTTAGTRLKTKRKALLDRSQHLIFIETALFSIIIIYNKE